MKCALLVDTLSIFLRIFYNTEIVYFVHCGIIACLGGGGGQSDLFVAEAKLCTCGLILLY